METTAPCLFCHDTTNPEKPVLVHEVTPGCEWVFYYEGIATAEPSGSEVTPSRSFHSLFQFLGNSPDVEGVLFTHKDGRTARITRKDYGLSWSDDSHG